MGLISQSGGAASQWATMWNFSDIFRICGKNDFSLFYQIMKSSIKFLDILVTSRISEGKRKKPESIILSFVDFTDCHLLHMLHLRPYFDYTLLKKLNILLSCFWIALVRIDFSTIAKAWPNSWNWSHIAIWWRSVTVGHNAELFGHFPTIFRPCFDYTLLKKHNILFSCFWIALVRIERRRHEKEKPQGGWPSNYYSFVQIHDIDRYARSHYGRPHYQITIFYDWFLQQIEFATR